MIYINKYLIMPSPSFEKELRNIYRHLAINFKEPIIADNFYHQTIKKINSLQFFPERYVKISTYKNINRNIRRLLINKYVVIYEVDNNTGQVFILHIFHSSQNYFNQL